MSYHERMNQFVRGFPFPWSTAPMEGREEAADYMQCERSVRRSLIDFELFLEDFRRQMEPEKPVLEKPARR